MVDEKSKAYHERYYKKHREVILEQQRAYRHTDAGEKVRKKADKRRKRRKVGEPLTPQQWGQVLEAFGYRCTYCGRDDIPIEQLTRDHRIPVERGGTESIENIVPACRTCNTKKGTKTEVEFRLELKKEAADGAI